MGVEQVSDGGRIGAQPMSELVCEQVEGAASARSISRLMLRGRGRVDPDR